MQRTSSASADPKRLAAERALTFVEPGMVVGLGSGSTAALAIRRLGQLLASGQLYDIQCIPTSRETERIAREAGIALTSLEVHPSIDVTIDGADEVDPQLDLIKGLGGALLREKLVALATRQEVIAVDRSKLVQRLGERAPVPVEVIAFAWRLQVPFLESLGARPVLRLGRDGQPFVTDEGNFILDCYFGPLSEPVALAQALHARPGIVEHGLFLGMASAVVVASSEGIEILTR